MEQPGKTATCQSVDTLELPCDETLEHFIMFTDKLNESRWGHAKKKNRERKGDDEYTAF